MKLKTWHVENAVVIAALLTVWFVTGCKPIELLGSAAVYCGFCCGSISDRMIEQEAQKDKPSVSCYKLFWWFFICKEIAWAVYFTINGAWSALVGCFIFGAYPWWRKLWRYYHPIK